LSGGRAERFQIKEKGYQSKRKFPQSRRRSFDLTKEKERKRIYITVKNVSLDFKVKEKISLEFKEKGEIGCPNQSRGIARALEVGTDEVKRRNVCIK